MATEQRITVRIARNGTQVLYEVDGVLGKACTSEDLTFLDALGDGSPEREFKPEYQQDSTLVHIGSS